MPNLGIARLTVCQRDGGSVVVDQYSQAPLQLHRPLYLDSADDPTVFLKTPSSGLLDGDEHELSVTLEERGRLSLCTQGCTLVYPGKSKINVHCRVGAGGELIYHPHPLILASGAELEQSIRIDLRAGAKLSYSDSWSAGRVSMNEAWQFKSFKNRIEIYAEGELVYRENICVCPAELDVRSRMVCGDFTLFSTIYSFAGAGDEPRQYAAWQAALPGSDSFWLKEDEDTRTWSMRRGSCIIRRLLKR